ncbi:MAG: hypothetical protein CMO01_09045 [Thalassobius sp.]|nr:hypothetical protein [Thalassovita sp.]
MIICITNQKGGVGKTTSASAMSSALAQLGKKVIAIDLDPQGNLSSSLGFDEPQKTIEGVLFSQYDVEEALHKVNDNLLVCPSTKALGSFEIEMLNKIGREKILTKKIGHLEEMCDFIILDTPPSINLLTVNALSLTQDVLVPINAEKFSIEGLKEVLITIEMIQEEINPKLNFVGAFFTMFNKQKLLSKAMEQEVNTLLGEDKVFNTKIRVNVALQEAYTLGQPVYEYAPESPGAKDYMKIAQEYLKMLSFA